jgi:hypothetical protein
MKRVIYEPAVDEYIPEGGVYYNLPVANKDVVDIIVDDDFATTGTIYYDSVLQPTLGEPFVHHFAGWELKS